MPNLGKNIKSLKAASPASQPQPAPSQPAQPNPASPAPAPPTPSQPRQPTISHPTPAAAIPKGDPLAPRSIRNSFWEPVWHRLFMKSRDNPKTASLSHVSNEMQVFAPLFFRVFLTSLLDYISPHRNTAPKNVISGATLVPSLIQNGTTNLQSGAKMWPKRKIRYH